MKWQTTKMTLDKYGLEANANKRIIRIILAQSCSNFALLPPDGSHCGWMIKVMQCNKNLI